MPVLNTYDIIGRSFILPPQEDGQKLRVHTDKINDYHETKSAQYTGHTQFICSVNDITLSITFQTKSMKILYEILNILSPMREHLTNPLPITNNPIVM